MAAETQYTANTGMATINAANTSLTGSGTLNTDIWTVITAASNGTKVKSVTIKAKGSTSAQGMVRLFIYDGVSTTRLLAEVEIPIVTQSTSDECFEKYLELDLDLLSGYQIRATTQIGDTFNIIAEGLDWAYYTNAVRPDSTNYTANTAVGIVSTANSNLDGTTGSNVTILTAGAAVTYKGCMIKSIVIKGTGSTTADGMVRLYVQDTGSTTKLLTEVPVPVITQSGTARSFFHQIDFPGGFNLQAGYKIIASTEKGNTFVILIEADDWKYPSATFVSNYTPASGTAVTTEELLHSLQVPANTIASGNLLEVYASLAITSNANAKTFRIYINTSNTLTAATLIATAAVQANVTTDCISRYVPIINDTTMESYGGTTVSNRSQYATSTGTSANVTVPSVSAGFWILISGQKAVAGDTDTIRWSMASKVF
jgi:hypothetical protein